MGGQLVNSRGTVIEITGIFTIGRAKECRLHPKDDRLPLYLALIVCEAGRFLLFVLRPGDHLQLNRQPAGPMAALEDGDRLEIGRGRWRFRSGERETRAGPVQEAAPPGPVAGPAVTEREQRARLQRRFGLTAREAEVLFWRAEGKEYKEIATILEITHFTIHAHIKKAHTKLGVENGHGLVRMVCEELARSDGDSPPDGLTAGWVGPN